MSLHGRGRRALAALVLAAVTSQAASASSRHDHRGRRLAQQAPAQQAAGQTVLLPRPIAFFPLQNGSLNSILGSYAGSSENVRYSSDSGAGGASVLDCSKVQFGSSAVGKTGGSRVVLNSVPYGADSGRFALSLWFKPENTYGSGYQYLYSHSSQEPSVDDIVGNTSGPANWGPNQVRVYFPESASPDFGIVRAIVSDSSDADRGDGSVVYLDSDGEVGGAQSVFPNVSTTSLNDGLWHLVTLTTHPQGGLGYQLYLDGQLVNELDGNLTYFGPTGAELQIDGGRPLALNGSILLCGRTLGDEARGYSGRLTQLGLWDAPLTPQQVAALHAAGANSTYFKELSPQAGSVQAVGVPASSPPTGAAAAASPTGSPCAPACRNGGACVASPSTSDEYLCDCPAGYVGADCGTPLGDFIPSAAASPRGDGTPAGASGPTGAAGSGSSPCVPRCRNGGRCVADPSTSDEYLCDCPAGWAGPACGRRLTDALSPAPSFLETNLSALLGAGAAQAQALGDADYRKWVIAGGVLGAVGALIMCVLLALSLAAARGRGPTGAPRLVGGGGATGYDRFKANPYHSSPPGGVNGAPAQGRPTASAPSPNSVELGRSPASSPVRGVPVSAFGGGAAAPRAPSQTLRDPIATQGTGLASQASSLDNVSLGKGRGGATRLNVSPSLTVSELGEAPSGLGSGGGTRRGSVEGEPTPSEAGSAATAGSNVEVSRRRSGIPKIPMTRRSETRITVPESE